MFKVGDIVRITKGFDKDDKEGNPHQLHFADDMRKCIGHIGVIDYVQKVGHIQVIQVVCNDINEEWFWLPQCLELYVKKPLRDAKGRFIKAPIVAAKGVVAEPAIMPVAEPVKALAEPVVKKEKPPYDLRAALSKEAGTGICNYAIEFSKTGPRLQANDACHARLLWSQYGGECIPGNEIKAIAIVIAPHYKKFLRDKEDLKAAIYPRFVQYMLNDSPWAGCFITKDVDEALTKGILMNINENINHLVPAAMALRRANEFSYTLQHFGTMLDMGYSGNVAYLASGFAHNETVGHYPGHSALCDGLDYREVAKFFKHGFPGVLKPMYNDRTQTGYKVWQSMCPTDQYRVWEGFHIRKFISKCAVSSTKGEGFERRTEFNMEASLKKIGDALTKLLEKA